MNRPIRDQQPLVLHPPPQVKSGIERALSAKLPTPFFLKRVTARRDNAYLCNATHYEALEFIQTSGSSALEAYFVHIPHREGDDDESLSSALFSVIRALISK